jgi:hypothetical protein
VCENWPQPVARQHPAERQRSRMLVYAAVARVTVWPRAWSLAMSRWTWFLGVVANLGCSWLVPSSHELGRGAVCQA